VSQRISDRTWSELSKLFQSGVSANRAAKLCGVSETTARVYRDAEPSLPTCGCGRALKHRGPCRFRLEKIA